MADIISDKSNIAIEIEHLYNRFGTHSVHEDLNMTVKKGELVALVGGSGSGKTTLLRAIIMLLKPHSGQIYMMGEPVWGINGQQQMDLRKRFGMLFQSGALFSSLTVLENVMVPMKEHLSLSNAEMKELAELKIILSGLPPHAANLLPKELSGGMIKRAALARALALDPQLLFLDEPTAGLDPVGAGEFDDLMNQLKESLSLTIMMVTHDLDSLWAITDKVAFLGEKKILAYKPIGELVKDPHPLIQHYFQGPRGRATEETYGK
ncbi:ABC transporter ATP-binding protein [Wohlfahrtiimonas populi]|uniref:ABC transporter ATP-binding protein n=1 Tax=Wohlfahrtiimonas populi TaxID=1940240 RepID=UPI00098D32E6|nr:ATP-binding cassette domain-containing protein [Wohlfahrtiimonas populi]